MNADTGTELRSVTDEDGPQLERWRVQPASSPFDDFAVPGVAAEEDERLPPPEGLSLLLVLDGERWPIGTVQWHPVRYGPTRGSVAFNIGISLIPDARGRGHGSRAQALLAEYLFDRFPVYRVEAGTDVENLAEQRALERAGFRRDGVARGAQWRAGAWHDLVIYSRLRTDDTDCASHPTIERESAAVSSATGAGDQLGRSALG